MVDRIEPIGGLDIDPDQFEVAPMEFRKLLEFRVQAEKCLRQSELTAVISIVRRNTLIFVGKMECWNEIQASDIFYR